jgi:hypothetical protein
VTCRAALARRRRHDDDAIPRLPVLDVVRDGIDDAGCFPTEDVRERMYEPRCSGSDIEIEVVDTGRSHPHADLARAGLSDTAVDKLEHIRAAVCTEDEGASRSTGRLSRLQGPFGCSVRHREP